MIRSRFLSFACAAGLAFVAGGLLAQQKDTLGYQDTPMLPDGKWHVHDGLRPQPKVIDPGTASTQDAAGRPPSDALVLFDGKDLTHWRSDKDKSAPAQWTVEDGAMVIKPGSGGIHTVDEFQDVQLHVEFASPTDVKGNGQGRGNSGVFLYDLYEFQVLDSFNNPTYPDGQAAALYGQYPPLVNASRKPGEWQTYDIFFTAPRFNGSELVSPGYATIVHNGVLVHNHTKILGPMFHKQFPKYIPHPPKGHLSLQDHGNKVRFRNIWAREIKDYDQP
jgi:hypothetical protein